MLSLRKLIRFLFILRNTRTALPLAFGKWFYVFTLPRERWPPEEVGPLSSFHPQTWHLVPSPETPLPPSQDPQTLIFFPLERRTCHLGSPSKSAHGPNVPFWPRPTSPVGGARRWVVSKQPSILGTPENGANYSSSSWWFFGRNEGFFIHEYVSE